MRRIALIAVPVLVLGAVLFVLRGPNISNLLKQNILPEMEHMLGRKVIAQNIYLNVFPLYIEAKGLKVYDDSGSRILLSKRVKAYVGLWGLFEKRLTIRRLVIKEPELNLSRKQAEDIAGNVRRYLATPRENALKAEVKSIELQKATAEFTDSESGIKIVLGGFGGEAVLGDTARVIATAEQVRVSKEGMPDITAGISAAVLIRDNVLEIKKLTVDSFGSRMTGTGNYEPGQGKVKTELSLLFATIKKFFGLQRSGEGSVSVHGLISLIKDTVTLDMSVKGGFYIQTLMELLKVTEKIEGYVDLKGEVKGPLNKLVAKGSGELRSGNLFDVDVDLLKCRISYEDGSMRFTEGSGRFYNGTATVNASIALPVVNYYTLKLDFSNIDSRPVFKLIGWDPGVMPGKIKGTLLNSGSEFNPEGLFEYRSSEIGKNALGRVRDVSGHYSMTGDVVRLTDLKVSTGVSVAKMNGSADIGKKVLAFEGDMNTGDLVDLAGPYLTTVHGIGRFRGRIDGTFSDPVLSGHLKVEKPVIDSYSADVLEADIRYRKELLVVNSMTASGRGDTYSMNGSVSFRNAAELFDLSNPYYDLKASVRDADLGRIAVLFYPDFQGSGQLKTDLKISGKGLEPELSGEASVGSGTLYKVPFSSASFQWKYSGSAFDIPRLTLQKGKSRISGNLNVDRDGRFVFSAASEKLYMSDLVDREIRGEAVFSLKADGSGTVDKHRIVINADMIEGRLRDKPIGSGTLTAEIIDRDVTLRSTLLNSRIALSGKGRLEKEFPWEARAEFQPGRYDPLIIAFLKEAPEDLILNMNGSFVLRGDRNRVSASAEFRQVNLAMFGYSFTNDQPIKLALNDRRLVLDHITMRSGSNASVKVNGSLEIGKNYNITVEGGSSLAPFKSLSTKIGVLRGDAEFTLEITGDWEKPQINGGVNLTNGSISLRDYSYRISSLNGYLYLDNDRVVLEKLTGRLGGGDVDLTGVLYLKKFDVRRFYVEAHMNNISAAVSNDFTLNFDGTLLYKGTPEEQMLSGDVQVNRARYKERVEWKSWLFKAKKAERVRSEISPVEKTALNIRVTGKESIRVDNNIARADVNADLLLRGTIYRPVILGRLDTKEGTVYFRNNEFRILRASADFTDPNRINPVIGIAAETIVKGYKIKMNLEGQVNQFTMSLSSDPVLKEMDILSLLTVGQTGGQLKGLEGGVGAGEATSFVTGKIQDVVEERLRSITGLDRVQVDPRVSRTTGTVEPSVTVAKRLLGDKMFVTYTSSVGPSDDQIVKVEYFVNRNVSLIGIRDERGIIGGDVKFRFEFK